MWSWGAEDAKFGFMTNDSSKIIYWGIGILASVAVVVGGFFVWKNYTQQPQYVNNTNAINQDIIKENTVVAPSTGKEVVIEGVPTAATASAAVSAKEAYELFLAEAKKWKEDAVLVNLKSDKDVALDGKSSTWEAHFISKSELTKGWTAVMKNKVVADAVEEVTNAKNIVEPALTVDSGDAIKAGLGDLGQSEVRVSSIRLYQETEAAEWFWSIATDKGNITLIAR